MNIDFIATSDFLTTAFGFLSYGLLFWFMGWGVSSLISLFIKTLNMA